MKPSPLSLLALLGLLIAPAGVAAADADRLFVEVVQPALKQQCLGCHGEGNTFGKLDLTTREKALATMSSNGSGSPVGAVANHGVEHDE
jgi:hypothetical protein